MIEGKFVRKGKSENHVNNELAFKIWAKREMIYIL